MAQRFRDCYKDVADTLICKFNRGDEETHGVPSSYNCDFVKMVDYIKQKGYYVFTREHTSYWGFDLRISITKFIKW